MKRKTQQKKAVNKIKMKKYWRRRYRKKKIMKARTPIIKKKSKLEIEFPITFGGENPLENKEFLCCWLKPERRFILQFLVPYHLLLWYLPGESFIVFCIFIITILSQSAAAVCRRHCLWEVSVR